ncbi:enoyl-CoA hydratase-related protein [Hydrocarboniphaga effusa]|uniref:Enoyl-CoA hydratase/isomerase n=1 Tax=Hydrocarboniphaga effusa AP103 TaxID=1172194 RepID=I8I5D9_9GAMM|nr:enoyl-CoA hydratase-related protein [Hydrocarboniphaga effusa]EIT71616.1 enoyl-CoA hydratase/isomerase [Hydrocarboniphaga effusa AP103]
MPYELLTLEVIGKVALIRLRRPEALNALSLPLREELRLALVEIESDECIGATVITGDEKAFAAGADVRTLASWGAQDVAASIELRGAWNQIGAGKTPIIAAVSGFALGAGCELAMMCDFILAADNARFGQPEIKLGTIPGAGGTQRLTRLVGKSKAMEMVLTGRIIDAVEAERCGLVSRVIPQADLITEALKTAAAIAELSPPVVRLARHAVNQALETSLSDGLAFEQASFESTFKLGDRREGMLAFLDKRKPQFTSR